MAIAVTRNNSFKSLKGNHKTVKYAIALTAEAYVTGGIQITAAHMSMGDNFDSEDLGHDFKSIDFVEFLNNPDGILGYFFNYGSVDNTTEEASTWKLLLYNAVTGAQVPALTSITGTIYALVHGIPKGAPGGTDR